MASISINTKKFGEIPEVASLSPNDTMLVHTSSGVRTIKASKVGGSNTEVIKSIQRGVYYFPTQNFVGVAQATITHNEVDSSKCVYIVNGFVRDGVLGVTYPLYTTARTNTSFVLTGGIVYGDPVNLTNGVNQWELYEFY